MRQEAINGLVRICDEVKAAWLQLLQAGDAVSDCGDVFLEAVVGGCVVGGGDSVAAVDATYNCSSYPEPLIDDGARRVPCNVLLKKYGTYCLSRTYSYVF